MKRREEYIDIYRGIAVMFMVFGHVQLGTGYDYYIHAFHMPMWFFVSGWFFKDKGNSITTVCVDKAKKLIIPYLFFGFLHYWIAVLFWVKPVQIINLKYIKNLCLTNVSGLPIAGALWFLTCLFFAEIIFIFLRREIRNNVLFIIIVSVIAFFGTIYTRLFHTRIPWSVDVSFVAVGFIAIGYYFRKYSNHQILRYFLNLKAYQVLALAIVNTGFIFLNGYINLRTGNYANILLFWINAICGILVYWNLSRIITVYNRKGVIIIRKYLSNIGEGSCVYLCLNQLTILILENLIGMENDIKIQFAIGILTLIILYPVMLLLTKTRASVLVGNFKKK